MAKHESTAADNIFTDVVSPAARRWAYRVCGAALVVLGVYGFVGGEEISALNLLFAAVFAVASENVPANKE